MLQCFFEAHESSLCQLVDRTNISLEYISNPSDYLAIGYFIASLLSTSTADMPPIQLSLVQYKSTGEIYLFKLLLNELSSYTFRKQPDASLRKLAFIFHCYSYSRSESAIPLTEQLILIADHLKISSAISEFEMKDSDIQDGLFYIAEALQTNTSLTKLSLYNVCLQYTEKFGSALINMLRVNKSLKHLNFSAISLDIGILDCILQGLSHNTALTHLILFSPTFFSANAYDHTDWSFTNMLRVNKSLTHIDLSRCGDLDSLRVCCIFKGLRYNTSLFNLNLRNSGITATDPDTATAFIKMLQMNKSLTHLDLSFNESLSLEACCVFKGLQYSTSLVNLNLHHTGITATDPDTATSFTKMLQVNKSLKHLDFSHNKSFSLEAHCIFEGLQYNSSLVHLNLCCTGITTTDPNTTTALIQMLEANKSLTHLDLSQNKSLTLEAHCILECLLNTETSLVDLNLCCTGITATDPDTAMSLIKTLQVNKSLKVALALLPPMQPCEYCY